jgi:hypothetical protein
VVDYWRNRCELRCTRTSESIGFGLMVGKGACSKVELRHV